MLDEREVSKERLHSHSKLWSERPPVGEGESSMENISTSTVNCGARVVGEGERSNHIAGVVETVSRNQAPQENAE